MIRKLRRNIRDKIAECYREKKEKAIKKAKKKLPRRIQQYLRRRYLKKHSFDFSYFSYVWDLDVKPNIDDCHEEKYDTGGDCDVLAIREFLRAIMSSHCHKDFIGHGSGSYSHKGYDWTCEEVAQDLRVYLKYLGKWDHTYKSGVWREMAKIEDNWTLIQLSRDLIGYMWD